MTQEYKKEKKKNQKQYPELYSRYIIQYDFNKFWINYTQHII